MAVPKSRNSKAKRDKRRSHDGLGHATLSSCPQCKEPKLPHRVCRHCGTYRDRAVLEVEED